MAFPILPIEHFHQTERWQLQVIKLAVRSNNGESMHPVPGMKQSLAETVFKAFARALRMALEIDPRAAGVIPSTKGSL